MQVLKFGGTSVANAENIKKVMSIIQQALKKESAVVVISALGGTTDRLIEAAKLAATGNDEYKKILLIIEDRHLNTVKELLPIIHQSGSLSKIKKMLNDLDDICVGLFLLKELSAQALDNVVSYGELLSSIILSAYANAMRIGHKWVDARDIIKTNSIYGNATVDFGMTNKGIVNYLKENKSELFIVPGFIASSNKNITTTLGRGGSDYTAAIIAAAINASVVEIWTDVDGMMTADPRLVSSAHVIDSLSYQEAMELSYFGAKVIYPPTIQPILASKIPMWVKNTFAPLNHGTLIQANAINDNGCIRGLSCISNIVMFNLEGSSMIGIPGIAKRLFEVLSKDGVNVILITQACSEHSICLAVDEKDAEKAMEAINGEFSDQIDKGYICPVEIKSGLSLIALVGDNMRFHSGVSGKMFAALGKNGINVRAIAQGSSERNISAVVSCNDAKKGLNVLHEEFFEHLCKQVNIYIVGVGNVGSQLLEKIILQFEYLASTLGLQVKVVGIGNSKKMLLNEDGLDLNDWRSQLQISEAMNMQHFVNFIAKRNLRNSIFVDVTADRAMPMLYETLLRNSVSIVACNKGACSSKYSLYSNLKKLANEFNAPFVFETNVGAGLPLVSTLSNLISSGDKVNKIEAVLSGSLNYVFNHYNGNQSFADTVREAQLKGFTEPNPYVDLSCSDVMRKLLILSREAGHKLEMDDVNVSPFLPMACRVDNVNDFYKELSKHESYFKNLYDNAKSKGCRLKLIAILENSKASVSLQEIGPEHEFYNLKDSDNIVLFYTNYYKQPLVIRGAGAGAEVTAAGVLADIIKVASK